jgi:hypothetical protein
MIAVIIRQPHAAAGILLLLGLLLAAGCAADRTAEAQAAATPTDRTGPAAVVLVAGSDEEPVFDNARLALEEELRRASPAPLAVTSLSAAPDASPVVALPATLANIETAFARTAPGASACFLFATSHGSPEGMQLTPGDEVLAPARLDAILDRHCAGRPTVAIISACFSGVFASGPLPDRNRIILTAAARDRPSFGCSDDLTYTYFDEALLKVLPRARRWDELYASLKAEVTVRERELGARPSLPQASFGRSVPPDLLLKP